MIPIAANDFREFLVWLVSAAIVVLGFRYVGRVIAFLLDKLYQIFIQQS